SLEVVCAGSGRRHLRRPGQHRGPARGGERRGAEDARVSGPSQRPGRPPPGRQAVLENRRRPPLRQPVDVADVRDGGTVRAARREPFALGLVESAQTMIELPYGIADFRRIRRQKMVYVDRTAYI